MLIVGASVDDLVGPSGNFSVNGMVTITPFILITTVRPGKSAGITDNSGKPPSTLSKRPLRLVSRRNRTTIR
jgi:hypothetical protein